MLSIFVVGIITNWATIQWVDSRVRDDLNTAAVAACLAGQTNLTNYNLRGRTTVEALEQLRLDYRARGESSKAAVMTATIETIRQTMLDVPSDRDCYEPIIRR